MYFWIFAFLWIKKKYCFRKSENSMVMQWNQRRRERANMRNLIWRIKIMNNNKSFFFSCCESLFFLLCSYVTWRNDNLCRICTLSLAIHVLDLFILPLQSGWIHGKKTSARRNRNKKKSMFGYSCPYIGCMIFFISHLLFYIMSLLFLWLRATENQEWNNILEMAK